jgi:hypothetical protein
VSWHDEYKASNLLQQLFARTLPAQLDAEGHKPAPVETPLEEV